MTTPALRDRLAALLAPRFVLERELASGGMAQVFLGHDPVLGRDVVIKLLPPEQATAVARERFLREARLLAQLTHPHVVPILEAHEQGDLLWFVMPRMEGDTLAHRILEGALPLSQVQRIGDELLDALAFAHGHDVIHRDVKPANIFLHGDHALLADFGVAQLRHPDDDTLTEAGRLLGTLRYMTPEQLTGAPATPRSDLYSLGATLYEAATGRQWSPALHQVAATWQGIAPGFAAVLRRALEPLPERRWQDAQSFRRALGQAGRRRLPRPAVATGIVTVGVVAAAMLFTRPSAAPVQNYDLRIMPFEGVDSALANSLTSTTTSMLAGFPWKHVVPWYRVAGLSAAHVRDSATFTARITLDARPTGEGFRIEIYDSLDHVQVKSWVPGDRVDQLGWSAAVADSLVAQLWPTLLTEFRQFAMRSNSLEAWRDYSKGEIAFQAARWAAADSFFRHAHELDSGFTIALWYRNLARQFDRKASPAELSELAGLADRLPPPLGDLVRVQVDPDLDGRMARFQRLADSNRYYPPARLLYANELFSRGPLVGRSLSEGVVELRDAAAVNADLAQATTYMHVIWGGLRLGEEPMAREALTQRAAIVHDKFSGFLRLATEGRFRPWLARPLLRASLWFADSEFVAGATEVTRMGLEFDVPNEQLTLGRLLASARHGPTDQRRASGFAAEATALLLLGRPLEALRQLDSGAVFVPRDKGYQLQRWEWRVLLPMTGVEVPRALRDTGRDSLMAMRTTDPLWPRAAWALAVDADQRGDLAARDQWRTALRARARTDSVARHMLLFADAIALGTDGNVDGALDSSRAIHRDPGDLIEELRGPLMRALVYLRRADWQRKKGDSVAADREWLWAENNDLRGWPAGEPQEGELDAALSALVRLHRAQNYVRLDLMDKACPLFKRVKELWQDAEPTFRWLRDTVQQGVDRCRA